MSQHGVDRRGTGSNGYNADSIDTIDLTGTWQDGDVNEEVGSTRNVSGGVDVIHATSYNRGPTQHIA